MTELLKRWSRLEPERCSVGALSGWVTLSGTERSVPPTTMLAGERALLLAAVIEAIEARGWYYRLAWRMPQSSEHYGVIWVERKDGWRKSFDHYAETPAAALLGAYVAALEAEAGQ